MWVGCEREEGKKEYMKGRQKAERQKGENTNKERWIRERSKQKRKNN